jgi:6-phosphogluconolactonase (cycloisomerase 2 family)
LTFATAHTSPFHSRPRVLAIDPAGAHLYVAADFSSSLTMYRRDQVTGELALNESITDNEARERARSLRLSPDDAHVYVASPNRDGVEVYSRDPASGVLTFVERQQDGVAGVSGLQGAWSVAVSPDGGHVYVAGTKSDAVAVFGRDGGSGALTFVEAQVDGSAGVDGLAGVRGIAVSPDGAHVYVAADVDDALAVFGRDGGTGALTFVEALFDGSGGVDGLDGARDVSVSPDGDHVYVAAAADDAVAVFSRDSGSGQLTFVEAKTDGAGGADRLDGASALAVSSDGAQVYVVAALDEALTVFDRDAGSGALTFAEVHVDTASIGLQRPGSVAVSADGASVYATAEVSHALVRFERNVITGALTHLATVRDGSAPCQRVGRRGVGCVEHQRPRHLRGGARRRRRHLVSGDGAVPVGADARLPQFQEVEAVGPRLRRRPEGQGPLPVEIRR